MTVDYKGWLDGGKAFDSSYDRGEATSFPLNAVIKGWTEGVQLVGTGGMIELEIPFDGVWRCRQATADSSESDTALSSGTARREIDFGRTRPTLRPTVCCSRFTLLPAASRNLSRTLLPGKKTDKIVPNFCHEFRTSLGMLHLPESPIRSNGD